VPHFDCLVGHPPCTISAGSPQWTMPLPTDRLQAAGGADGSVITYGDYFTAACDYLSRNRIMVPGPAPGQWICLDAATHFHIHLIKHGAFYHPALIRATASDASLPLVLNVAVSPVGRRQMPIEVESLRMLAGALPENWVPQVYAAGDGCAPGHPPLPMFIGQWFADFHEVHRTNTEGNDQRWCVWDDDCGHWHLDTRQVADFHRQAVRVLAGSFDPHTLSAVLEWHHAAGDFVVRKNGDGSGIEVRLITVRRYAPLFHLTDDEALDGAMLLEALAAFWMRTSMWMRIDRIDGVGELVWAEDQILAPMWQGFLEGLGVICRYKDLPAAFPGVARRLFAERSARDWLSLGAQLAARYPSGSPEGALIKRYLDRHALAVASIVQTAAISV
jgi:hypothetical protein